MCIMSQSLDFTVMTKRSMLFDANHIYIYFGGFAFHLSSIFVSHLSASVHPSNHPSQFVVENLCVVKKDKNELEFCRSIKG